MAAEVVATHPELRVKSPQRLFEGSFIPWQPNLPRNYDVAPDGRFLMIEQPPTYFTQRLAGIENWFEELKRLVPTK